MNNQVKSVKGERFAAAIIDSILAGIIGAIPLVLFVLYYGWDDWLSLVIGDFTEPTTGGNMDDETFLVLFTVVSMLSGFIIGVLYFVFGPYKMNGQTLGKKMLRIKAIDEFGHNPSFKQHFIRAIQNWQAYVGVVLLPLILWDYMIHSLISGGLTSLVGFVAFVSYIFILARPDGRGIHDSMANTLVVHISHDPTKQFIEQATQMSDWAEIDYNEKTDGNKKQPEEAKDDWYE